MVEIYSIVIELTGSVASVFSDIHAGGLVLLSSVLLSLSRRSQAEVALCFGLSTDSRSGEGEEKMGGIEGKESVSLLSVQA